MIRKQVFWKVAKHWAALFCFCIAGSKEIAVKVVFNVGSGGMITDSAEAPMSPGWTESVWRRERDSNPRYPSGYIGFQDRLFQPLTHPSAAG